MTHSPPLLYGAAPAASWLPAHDQSTGRAQPVIPERGGTLFDVALADPETRISEWQRGISDLFTDLSPQAIEPAAFTGSIETIHRGNICVSHIVAGAQRVRRGRHEIGGSVPAMFFLNIQLEGHGVVRHDKGETQQNVGDCVLVDPRQPYILEFQTSFRQLCVQLPDWWLRERLDMPAESAVGLPVNMSTGGGPVLRAALESVINPPQTTDCDTTDFVELFMDVVNHNLRSVARRENSPHNSVATNSFGSRLEHFIGRHFRDEALSPAMAAAGLGCSVRYIHKICHGRSTTFGRMVIDARLAAAARALSCCTNSGARISTVAYECGFNDISHFCRVFRQKFGVPPSRFRAHRS